MTTKEQAIVRLSPDLRQRVAVVAAQRGVTKKAALESLLSIGLNVHGLIESGLILPKSSTEDSHVVADMAVNV
ncbi:hypothetical protein H6G36_25440 [Anabaena minutissima FACHB-250]|nr:hypothetical protein [Anabaena minutissima FACHB-250]